MDASTNSDRLDVGDLTDDLKILHACTCVIETPGRLTIKLSDAGTQRVRIGNRRGPPAFVPVILLAILVISSLESRTPRPQTPVCLPKNSKLSNPCLCFCVSHRVPEIGP
jgi:hypothetical protein